jgi:hypothetical protein
MTREHLKSQWLLVSLPALIVTLIVLALLAGSGFLILARLGLFSMDLP